MTVIFDYEIKKIKNLIYKYIKVLGPESRLDYVLEDLSVMNDFELHNLCLSYKCLDEFKLEDNQILDSGKFERLDQLLDEAKRAGDRLLLFSQYKIMLDILEAYMSLRGHKYLRLDGTTKVELRQGLIDEFNKNNEILVFMLTTKAGGVGINLTGANRVVIHDIDFNPQNDKQAEDRCHRVGQTKEVSVYHLISKYSIEEKMVDLQRLKLELDADLTSKNENLITKTLMQSVLNNILDS